MSDDLRTPSEARARAVGNAVFLEHIGGNGDIASWGMPSRESAEFVAGEINALLNGLRASLADAAEKAGRYAHEMNRKLDAVELRAQAATIAELEAGVRGKDGIWPSWVYEARAAIKHRDESLPWLPDLLKALGWQSGSIHDALNAVWRLAEADKTRGRAAPPDGST